MGAVKLLAIETSSATGSVALGLGERVAERIIETPREQTERLLVIVDELLAEAGISLADLDALVFGRGPGSFTGLRVAAAAVQGLSLATGVPIVSISSLAALAQAGFERARAPDMALCCVDARMGEVYWGRFARAGALAVADAEARLDVPEAVGALAAADGEERLGPPESVVPPEAAFLALGDGLSAHETALASVRGQAQRVDAAVFPGARQLLALAVAEVKAGRFVELEAAVPVYLRGADAWRRS